MGKTLLYLLLLAILGTGVYFFVFKPKTNVFGDNEAGFTIKDTGAIGKIYMARTNGESVTLTRTDSGWILNNRYRARENPVTNLLTTMSKQTAQFPVPENAHNHVVKSLAGNSVKVEVYDRSGNNMRTFYVGNEAHNFTGSYMLIEHAQKPYVVQIPGFEGYPSPFYGTDLADWRDRTVFDESWGNIRSVSVQYPEEPRNSFTMERKEQELSVHVDPLISGNYPLNKDRAASYMKFFEHISCEGFLNGLYGIDSMLATVPRFAAIELTNRQGRKQHVDFYYMPINKRSKNRMVEVPSKYDPDRYYAVMNNFQDTAIIQHIQVSKLFRKAYEFYTTENTVDNKPQ